MVLIWAGESCEPNESEKPNQSPESGKSREVDQPRAPAGPARPVLECCTECPVVSGACVPRALAGGRVDPRAEGRLQLGLGGRPNRDRRARASRFDRLVCRAALARPENLQCLIPVAKSKPLPSTKRNETPAISLEARPQTKLPHAAH